MVSTNKDITQEEAVNATYKATEVMIQYMGTTEKFQLKVDKGLMYLRWMMSIGLIIVFLFIGGQVFQALNPSSTQVDRNWIVQQQRSIDGQQENLNIRRKQINMDAAKNTTDALINLAASEALAKDRADIAIARSEAIAMQQGSIRRDSLFNQKKPVNVKTVNAKKVNTVNSKTTNINKK